VLTLLEKEKGSTDCWVLPEGVNIGKDMLRLAIRNDEPEILRYFIRLWNPPKGWDAYISWILGLSVEPPVMAKALLVFCEEGIHVVDMVQFAMEHHHPEISDRICEERPEVTAQFKLLQAIKSEQHDVVCQLLSLGVWHERAVALAAETENAAVCDLLSTFLRQLHCKGVWEYWLKVHSASVASLSLDGLDFLHRCCCDCGADGCRWCSRAEVPWFRPRLPFFFIRPFHQRHHFIGDSRSTEPENFGGFGFGEAVASVRLSSHNSLASSSRRMMALGIGLMLRTLDSGLSSHLDKNVTVTGLATLRRLCSHRLVWRDGIRATRRLMGGIPPTTAYEMLTLLMSTYATAAARYGRIEPATDRVQ
jgi:hypothetical protein